MRRARIDSHTTLCVFPVRLPLTCRSSCPGRGAWAILYEMPLLVAPFFRASVTIDETFRGLFAREVSDTAFLEALRRCPGILRQNLRRLYAASRLAEASGGRLALVEGWRSNVVLRPRGRSPRAVTGSWTLALLLRLLRRRGLVRLERATIRREESCCTWEEARAIAAVAASLGAPTAVIGISDSPCPHPDRAARYLRSVAPGGSVLTPEQALARSSRPPTEAETALWQALASRTAERLCAPLLETPNWALHLASESLHGLLGGTPAEVRIARALRRDRTRASGQ